MQQAENSMDHVAATMPNGVSGTSATGGSTWPLTATRDAAGELQIAGVPVSEMVQQWGTPLYIYDVATLRAACQGYMRTFAEADATSRVVYAGKAGMFRALLQVIVEEGLGLDIVSAGELQYAIACGVPAQRINFHGNNKTPEELALALDFGINHIIVDNLSEIDLLRDLTRGRATPQDVLLRINPAVDVHTHEYRKTGLPDSKFGLGIETGDAELAVQQLLEIPGVRLCGYHAHIGSQIFEAEPYLASVDVIVDFAAQMYRTYGVEPEEINPGGGFGIPYLLDDPVTPVERWAETLVRAVRVACERHDLPDPVLAIEPGRSIVGQAGIAVYTVGARKEIAGIRTYVSVDGGMADNIRPALYGAEYTAAPVLLRADAETDRETVTIAGKYCESGDVLIQHIDLPRLQSGDLLAMPMAGAYCLAMSSNYNLALRPAVVFVDDRGARLVQRRETLEDLLRRDIDG